MTFFNDIKWDLDDITITPSIWTTIESRSECNILTDDYSTLPLMAAPMDTVLDENNYKEFVKNKIVPCLPRGKYPFVEDINFPIFYSYGLKEFEILLNIDSFYHNYILVDIANGHMRKLHNLIKQFKTKYPDKILMVGNIANPYTYKLLAELNVDFVRVGIGTGNACTTSANTGVNYPLGSLISECKKIKNEYGFKTKIVADGGMKNYSDIMKSLSLGCDYVMVGSIFNKSLESSGFNYWKGIKISNNVAKFLWKKGFNVKKKYRGMSTKSVQKNWGKSHTRTAEGITKYQNIEYTLSGWIENFKDYLTSVMSYCDTTNLSEFIGNGNIIHITNTALHRYKK